LVPSRFTQTGDRSANCSGLRNPASIKDLIALLQPVPMRQFEIIGFSRVEMVTFERGVNPGLICSVKIPLPFERATETPSSRHRPAVATFPISQNRDIYMIPSMSQPDCQSVGSRGH
jgi:hypothetical protein